VGLSLLLRVPFLGLPLISDEGGYAYVTERWLAGEGRLYHDLWVSRPQGIFLAYAGILETLGRDAVALRLGTWVWAVSTLLVVWRFAGRWRGAGAAALAALVSCRALGFAGDRGVHRQRRGLHGPTRGGHSPPSAARRARRLARRLGTGGGLLRPASAPGWRRC
jgi:hypothetical protein